MLKYQHSIQPQRLTGAYITQYQHFIQPQIHGLTVVPQYQHFIQPQIHGLTVVPQYQHFIQPQIHHTEREKVMPIYKQRVIMSVCKETTLCVPSQRPCGGLDRKLVPECPLTPIRHAGNEGMSVKSITWHFTIG